jgi:hypothetical protein
VLATTDVTENRTSVVDSVVSLTIGRTAFGAQELSAILDEVAFYDSSLSPDRIALHYTVGIGR